MNKQMMDLGGSSSPSAGDGGAEGGKLFDLINPQESQHSHGRSSDNVSGMRKKKQEILSSNDFLPIKTVGSANHSSVTNLDGIARGLESGGSILRSDAMGFFSFIEPHEQPKVSCEMTSDAYDVTTVREIDRTVKKYADNILHTLEGVSSRLVQLESKTQQLETSVGELMNNSGSASGKLSQLENILREVQTGVQVLRYKQEIAEAQFQLSKLQQSSKQDQTPSPPKNSNPVVSQQAPLPPQPSYQQLPHTSVSDPPLKARISLSSAPPHSHHAPNKLLPLQPTYLPPKSSPSTQPSPLTRTLPQSQQYKLPQHLPQTPPPPPQKPLPQAYPQINCQPYLSGSHGARNNTVKRKSSSIQDYENSSCVGEEYVEEVIDLGKKNIKRWDENDQVNLAKAWSCISNSPKNGVNRDEKSFWRGIMKEYNANHYPAKFRSVYALKSYWKLMKQQCLLWKKVLSDFNFQMGSDGASTNLIKDVKTKFKSLNNGRKFEYKAAFEVLKECPKWSAIDVDMGSQRPVRRRRTSTSTDTSQESSEASMPSGSNSNTPTSDIHSSADVRPKSPHKFISEDPDEQSIILLLQKQKENEHLQEKGSQAEMETDIKEEKSQDMDNLPVMTCDMSKLTPDLSILLN